MTPQFDKDLFSIAQLSSHLQKPSAFIEAATERMRLRPGLRLNGVAYYNAKQVEILTAAINAKGSK